MTQYKRRWRDYRTQNGKRPVKDFLVKLPLADQAAVLAEMKAVADEGLTAARHLRGDIWEVRAVGLEYSSLSRGRA